MSNNRNLGNIATAITNATSGQVLTSQGSGVATFADAGGTGVTVHNNQAAMLYDAASADEGSLHYENLNNKLYVKQSSGFFLLASITNTAPTVSGFTETTGSGSATTIADNGTFKLTSGSNTVITLTATEPDLETLVYSATVTSGTASNVISSPSLPISNQSGNTFTLTPVTSGASATVTIRFDVSDGSNVVNKTHSFSIVFTVVDTNHTTLLATAVGTSDNDDIIDSSTANSGNPYSITVNNDATAGTFSPHRSGGYSTYFDGNGDSLNTTATQIIPSTSFTVTAWVYFNDTTDGAVWGQGTAGHSGRTGITIDGNNWFAQIGSTQLGTSTSVSANIWYYTDLQWDGSTLKFFVNGSLIGSSNTSNSPTNSALYIGDLGSAWSTGYPLNGYVSDLKVVSGTPSGSSTVPTEPLSSTGTELHTCHLPYIADGSTNDHSITVNGDVSTKPFSPYDYEEYNAADHGGSVFITGSSKLEVPSCSAFSGIGVGDYTFECWHYNSTNDSGDALDFRSAGDGVALVLNSGSLKVYYTGSAAVSSANSVVKPYIWNHLVFCRVSNVLKGYVNGKQVFTHNDTTNLGTSSAGTGYIGSNAGSSYLNGYFSGVRITNKGVYTGEFTPPTAPLEITQSAGTNIAAISSGECKLLVKGTDASIIDKSQGSNLKLVGAVGSTGQVRTGDWANSKTMYFDGTDDYIIGPTISDLNIGTGDFTVECWLYETTTNTNKGVWDGRSTYNTTDGFVFIRYGTDTFRVYSGSALIDTGSFTIQNQWVHCALVRSSGTLSVYINGNRSGTPVSNSTNFSSSGTLKIGGGMFTSSTPTTPNAYITGYIQDFRVSNFARYTASDETANIPSAPLEG